jgi:transcriptional regulator with XRE-family HTH domain
MRDNNLKSLGDRLSYIMDSKGLSAYKVSQDTGISQSNLSRLKKEKQKPNSTTLEILANYLQIRKDWLLKGEGAIELNKEIKQANTGIKSSAYYHEKFGNISDEDLRVLFMVNHDRLLKVSPEYQNFIGMIEAKAKEEYLKWLVDKGIVKPSGDSN